MEFFPALYSSLLDLVNIPIVITYALLMAILLNKKFKGRGFFRVIFILPLLLGSSVIMDSLQGNHAEVAVSMGVTGQSVADTVTNSFQDILLNHQLQTFFGERLSGYVGNIINRISSVMWISSIQIIIFLGALQNIPQSLYEAAEIDGASEFEKFWKITLPMVMPSVELNVVFTVINSFTSSDNALMTYISNVSFKNLMLSYGSAMAWMYFLLVGIIMAVILMVIRKIAKQYES
jgi:ABC-type sugar transport system permease subunit